MAVFLLQLPDLPPKKKTMLWPKDKVKNTRPKPNQEKKHLQAMLPQIPHNGFFFFFENKENM